MIFYLPTFFIAYCLFFPAYCRCLLLLDFVIYNSSFIIPLLTYSSVLFCLPTFFLAYCLLFPASCRCLLPLLTAAFISPFHFHEVIHDNFFRRIGNGRSKRMNHLVHNFFPGLSRKIRLHFYIAQRMTGFTVGYKQVLAFGIR